MHSFFSHAEGSDEQAGVSLYTLPLHSLVLASASPGHFRPEFLRRQEETRPHSDCGEGHKPAEGSRSPGTSTDKTPDKASDSPPQAPLQASGAGDAKTRPGENEAGGKRSVQAVVPSCTWQLCPVYTWTLRLLPGEPQSVPQAVLCHVYTGELPDDPETLIWVSGHTHTHTHTYTHADACPHRRTSALSCNSNWAAAPCLQP